MPGNPTTGTRGWCFIAGGLLGEVECHLQEAILMLEKGKPAIAKDHLGKANDRIRDARRWYPIALLRELDQETSGLAKDLGKGRSPKDAPGRARSALRNASWARQRAGDLCGR